MTDFRVRYGPHALVIGGSEGLGAAWAERLAVRGLDLVLVARRQEPLDSLAADLRSRHGVAVETLAGDLRSPDWLDDAGGPLQERQIGMVVANAAVAPTGPFLDSDADQLAAAVEVNCLGNLRVVRRLLPPMVERGRGGLVLMSSVAGLQGAPGLATYAATKAFLTTLGEGLWAELSPHGVDVLACVAGAVATPGYGAATISRAPGTLDAAKVVDSALASLGRRPRVVPGRLNRAAEVILQRLLSRRAAVGLMALANRRVGVGT